TTIPSQALHLMNSQFVNDQARHLAARVLREAGPDPKAWVDRACQLTLSRSPRPLEHAEMLDFLMEQAERQAATAVASEAEGTDPADPRHEALVDLCHVLYGLNEFVYIN